MGELTDIEKRALKYIDNAGGAPRVEWFDEDHEPIGPQLRNQLVAKGVAVVDGEVIRRAPPESSDG